MLGRTYLYPFMRCATPDVARDGWNLYGYTGGNPINRVDPDGRETRAAVMLDQDARELLSGDITAGRHDPPPPLVVERSDRRDSSDQCRELASDPRGGATPEVGFGLR